MNSNIESISRLTNEFSKLPGVGGKTASRFAYYIIKSERSVAENFAKALIDVKDKVKLCPKCGFFVEHGESCFFCNSRKQDLICVVAEPKDVVAFEKVNNFNCAYHVLHGVISPLTGKGPNDIRIKELLERVKADNVKEIIIATNPDIEGEATAMYIAKLIGPLGVKVSRLAQGIQMGSDIEFADSATLQKALENRKTIF